MNTWGRAAGNFQYRTFEWPFQRQPWMSRYLRIFWLLLASQGACLALGLSLESRLTHSFTPTEVRGEAARSGAEDGPHPVQPEKSAKSRFAGIATRTIVFFWIFGLQAAAAYLVLSRIFVESARTRMAATRDSLQRRKDLVRTRDAVIFGLAKLAESRDPETGNHLERITLYSTRLAAALHRRSGHRSRINSTFVKLIGISSALHDIGKVGVEDAILLKPGPLTKTERALMESHAEIGGKCIRDIELRLGSSNFLQMAREIAFCHHERWDGAGYPRGLCCEDIPLSARIVAVCDVYDALSTRRVYKISLVHEKCVEIIRKGAGSQFDPEIVDAFLEIQEEFREIALRYVDPPVERPNRDKRCKEEAPRPAPVAEVEVDTSFPVPAGF